MLLCLFLRYERIQNTQFIGNLITDICWEFYYDYITVVSLVSMKYGKVAVESIPFSVAESANDVYSEMSLVYGDKWLSSF